MWLQYLINPWCWSFISRTQGPGYLFDPFLVVLGISSSFRFNTDFWLFLGYWTTKIKKNIKQKKKKGSLEAFTQKSAQNSSDILLPYSTICDYCCIQNSNFSSYYNKVWYDYDSVFDYQHYRVWKNESRHNITKIAKK